MKTNLMNYGVLALGCFPFISIGASEKTTIVRPNLIVILADDMGYGDLGCFGNTEIKTPNIDRMAAKGIRFTDFHSNSSVCTPTRAALLTGRYQQRAGLEKVLLEASVADKSKGLVAEEVTFAEVLKEAGYKTAVFGKWHVGEIKESNPLNQGFEEFVGYMTNPDYISHCSYMGRHDWLHGFTETKEKGYITELITRYSIDFIKKNKKNPFCLYIPHKTPHGPLQGPSDSAIWKENKNVRPIPLTARPKQDKAVYKDMIESLDQYIGELLVSIKDAGIEKNTLILFLSDNGPIGVGNAGNLRGRKGLLYEGGHRVPGIAYWPSVIAPGSICNDPVMGMDIFPTLLDVAGVNYKPKKGRELDGKSFVPLLQGKVAPKRTLFWRTGGAIAIREGDWKLIRQRGEDNPTNTFMLFNLSDDVNETKDVASLHPDLVKQLMTKLEVWETDVDSNVPERNKKISNEIQTEHP